MVSSKAKAQPRLDEPDEYYFSADGLEDFTEEQINLLRSKFRCKRDLYAYLETRGKSDSRGARNFNRDRGFVLRESANGSGPRSTAADRVYTCANRRFVCA